MLPYTSTISGFASIERIELRTHFIGAYETLTHLSLFFNSKCSFDILPFSGFLERPVSDLNAYLAFKMSSTALDGALKSKVSYAAYITLNSVLTV